MTGKSQVLYATFPHYIKASAFAMKPESVQTLLLMNMYSKHHVEWNITGVRRNDICPMSVSPLYNNGADHYHQMFYGLNCNANAELAPSVLQSMSCFDKYNWQM